MKSINKLYKYMQHLFPYFLFMALAILVVFPQIHHHIFIAGLDSYFHMNRFYEDAMQLKTGHFSYFISLFSFKQTGRIVNAFYGPWFSYLMGLLLLIVNSWLRFQIIFSILAIFLSSAFIYHLMRYNHVKTIYSILISLIYSLSFPMKILIFKQEFTGIGIVLFPLVILLGTKMVRERKVNLFSLSIIMAVIFQIHLLSGLISGLILLPFVIFALIKSPKRKYFCIDIIKAVGIFLLLIANLWGSLLDIGLSTHLIPTFPQTNMMDPIDAISLSKSNRYILLTPVDLKMLIIILLLIILSWRWINGLTRLVSIMSIVSFWLSSVYFPWDIIIRKFPIFANIIQFPKRFLPITYVLALFSLGLIISRINIKNMWSNRILKIIISMGLIVSLSAMFINVRQTMNLAASCWNHPRVLNFSNLIAHRYKSRELRKALVSSHWSGNAFIKVIPDYLPTSLKNVNARNYGNLYTHTQYQLDNENTNYRRKVTSRGLQLTWQNHYSADHKIKIPLVKYGHTQIILNHHKIANHKIHITSVGAMIINSHPGINQIKIYYRSSLWFKLLLIINVCSWLFIVYVTFYKRRRFIK